MSLDVRSIIRDFHCIHVIKLKKNWLGRSHVLHSSSLDSSNLRNKVRFRQIVIDIVSYQCNSLLEVKVLGPVNDIVPQERLGPYSALVNSYFLPSGTIFFDNITYIGEYRNSRYVTVIPKLVRGWIGVISVHRIQSVTMRHRSGL